MWEIHFSTSFVAKRHENHKRQENVLMFLLESHVMQLRIKSDPPPVTCNQNSQKYSSEIL